MKKITLFSITFIMLFMGVAGLLSGTARAASDEEIPVSTGLRVLAAESPMAVSAMGKELAFSPEDFERALNAKRIDYITVTALPDPAEGTLYLGSDGISAGKTISRENLHKLSFLPSKEGESVGSFSFSVGKGYEIECAVYMLGKENYCPMAGTEGELSLNVSTHRNISVFGELSGFDPDGDEISFEVVSYPQKGILTMYGGGEFVYTPSADYTGKDSFRYVVCDKYGNYSAASTVSIEIDRTNLSSVLSDMGGKKAHTSAITMVENGIMNYTEIDGKLLFSPDKTVSREDFLVMAMKAAGLSYTVGKNASGENVTVNTGFADDGDISKEAKNYVFLAKQKGIIKGSAEGSDSRFYPKRDITAAEAAVIIDKIIGGSDYVVNASLTQSVFADHVDIPVWAEESIKTLNCIGVMADVNGYIYPEKALDRSSCAMMLEAVMKMVED